MSDLSTFTYKPIPASMNQIANVKNRFQGETTKALCVCSAGMLRSPSIAKFLTSKGYNTRACGTSQEYALVPLSVALLRWADEIHVVAEQAGIIHSLKESMELNAKVFVYDIPDNFSTFDSQLMQIIEDLYDQQPQL